MKELLDRLAAVPSGLDGPRPSSAYVGGQRSWVRTLWGSKLLVDTTDLLIAPHLLLDGVWEPDVTKFFRETLKPGMTFVDVGANLGYFTILAAHLVGREGKVFAFEAQPATYELLSKNVVVNWVNSFTTVENKAVSSHTAILDFFARKYYPGNSSFGKASDELLEQHFDRSEKIQVPAVALDDYFAGRKGRVHFIKVDVEGAEVQVFRGMAGLIEDNRDIVIVCEWAPVQIRDVNDDPTDLLKEFERHKLQVFRIDQQLTPLTPERLLDTAYCNLALMRT